ncbi:MAG: Fur family zinc uptake transcriptional regulator, partial [Alphaproteobacteria bacterium]
EALKAAEALCEENGYRFTESRRQVFNALISSHKAQSAKDLMQKIANKQPPITYRALEFFTEIGIVHYIGSLNSYIACTHTHEDTHTPQLLICKTCSDVKEICISNPITSLIKAAKEKKFMPLETHIEVLGLCAECQH